MIWSWVSVSVKASLLGLTIIPKELPLRIPAENRLWTPLRCCCSCELVESSAQLLGFSASLPETVYNRGEKRSQAELTSVGFCPRFRLCNSPLSCWLPKALKQNIFKNYFLTVYLGRLFWMSQFVFNGSAVVSHLIFHKWWNKDYYSFASEEISHRWAK